ncbi:MAG: type II toxin-antitoxin system RelE/ParE family toxin [Candidatus Methanoperedens sp.]|nr:type II toxin-antitoxin system RelE/ParE family toxin [Candidatus Methanoperedens sp.]
MATSFNLILPESFKKIIKKLEKKDRELYARLEEKMIDVGNNPYIGKPLRNVLKNRWRIHFGSFVLIYRINEEEKEVRFLDFDHHDKIYKNPLK